VTADSTAAAAADAAATAAADVCRARLTAGRRTVT